MFSLPSSPDDAWTTALGKPASLTATRASSTSTELRRGVLEQAAAGELDAEVESAQRDAADRHDGDDQRDDDPGAAALHEVGTALVEPRADAAGPGDAADGRTIADERPTHRPLAQHARDDQRRHHRGDDADRQRHAEPLDGPGGEEEQQGCGQQGRDVGVDDRRPRLVESGVERGRQAADVCARRTPRALVRTPARWRRSPDRWRGRSRRVPAGSGSHRARRAGRTRSARTCRGRSWRAGRRAGRRT